MTDTTVENMEFFNAGENPQLNNAIVAQALAEPEADLPTIDSPDTSFTRLPVGVLSGTKTVRDFEVRELTGLAEERLSRIDRIAEPGRWFQTLLECGVVAVGGVEATPDRLKELVIGDREYLAMAIRAATYGDEVDLGQAECPRCGEVYPLTVSLSEVPIREFDGERVFEVPLKNGGKVHVALPDGNAQMALFEKGDMTDAERKSVMLAESVQMIEHKNGMMEAVAGFPSLIKNLGISDRNQIIAELSKRQPGPRYDEITRAHECGYEAGVGVGLMHLFPGL